MESSKVKRIIKNILAYLRTMGIFIIIWLIISKILNNPVLIPSPVDVGLAFYQLLASGELFAHMAVSLKRLLIGYVIAVAIGVPVGMLMARSIIINNLMDPIIEILRPISGIAWIPIGMFIFGVGNSLAIFIIIYATFFPIVVNTYGGVRTIDNVFIQSAQTMGLNKWSTFRHVIFPSALPNILVGLRVGVGMAWIAIVASELIGTNSGLGYAIEWYRQLIMTDKVVSFIIMIGILGYVSDLLLRFIQNILTPWSFSKVGGE